MVAVVLPWPILHRAGGVYAGLEQRRGEGRSELRDARLQRERLAVDARQRRAQAAVIGIEYGGGFRHDCRGRRFEAEPHRLLPLGLRK
jgi:hypothetical protein